MINKIPNTSFNSTSFTSSNKCEVFRIRFAILSSRSLKNGKTVLSKNQSVIVNFLASPPQGHFAAKNLSV